MSDAALKSATDLARRINETLASARGHEGRVRAELIAEARVDIARLDLALLRLSPLPLAA